MLFGVNDSQRTPARVIHAGGRCCDKCATECEKVKDDKHMAACAKSFRDCAKARQDTIKNLAA